MARHINKNMRAGHKRFQAEVRAIMAEDNVEWSKAIAIRNARRNGVGSQENEQAPSVEAVAAGATQVLDSLTPKQVVELATCRVNRIKREVEALEEKRAAYEKELGYWEAIAEALVHHNEGNRMLASASVIC